MQTEPWIRARVEEEFKRSFKAACARRGIKEQDVLRELASRWMREDLAAPIEAAEPPKSTRYKHQNSEWHDKLEHILVDGTPDQHDGIKSNLEAFVAQIKLRALERGGKVRKAAGG